MKKYMVITIKEKRLFEASFPMFLGKIAEQYQDEIHDNKIMVDVMDWDKKEKGRIVVEMEGAEEEINKWTKKSWKDKIALGIARLGISIDIRKERPSCP